MAKEDKFADEIMSDEELECVSGGTFDEMRSDVDNFEELGIKVYPREPIMNPSETYMHTMMNLGDAFKRFGVRVEGCNDDRTPNKYFVGDKNLSREEVWEYIKAKI